MDNNTVLFLAILSMDAYYRNPDGTLNTTSFVGVSGLQSDELGTATLVDQQSYSNTAFFADAWIWNEQYVIAYRGTVPSPIGMFLKEAYNGFGVGAGSPNGAQAQEAIQFYQQVADGNPDFDGNYADANTLLTGHSLGGGLAGFVAEIYGQQAAIFDSMSYEAAANAAYLESTTPLFDVDTGDQLADANGNPIVSNPALKNLIYGSQTPFAPNESSVTGFAVQGEILQFLGLRSAQSKQPQYLDPHGTPPGGGALNDAVDLHSPSLLVDLLWAQDNNKTAWQSVGTSLLGALFNGRVAGAIVSGETADTMMAEIAYSAIPNGYQPFGDTGIESLFSDADTLGEIQTAGEFTGLLSSQLTGSALSPLTGLAEIAVQFAGDQATAANTDQSLAQGAFELDGSTLTVDLDPTEWTTTWGQGYQQSATTTAVVGLGDFFDSVLSNISAQLSLADPTYSWIASNLAGFSAPLLTKLNEITEVDIALTGGDLSAAGSLPATHDKSPGSPGGAMLIGGDGQGSLTGTDKGNDIIIGGSTVTTGNGNDLILAGGPETITVGTGNNRILTDAGGMNVILDYAGGTTSASAGTDLVVGNAQGGDTFSFNDANQGAFTVVWGGTGHDTFDVNTDSSTNVNVLLLNMNGVTAQNITSLDMSKLESYVDTNYASEGSQGYGGGISEPPPTIVILNPTSTDTLEYNGVALSSPQVTTSSSGGTSAPEGSPSGYSDPASSYILEGYVPSEYIVESPAVTEYGGLPVADNAWETSQATGETINSLSSNNGINYSYDSKVFGTVSSVATLEASSAGSGALDLINFAPNEFGINLNAGAGVPRETETITLTVYAVTAWSQLGFVSLASLLPALEARFPGFVPEPGFTGVYFGVQPAALGGVVSTTSFTSSSGGDLVNPGTLPTGPALNINNFLTGPISGDPTNVSVAFFATNQALLDGQFYGYTVLDTATNVSSALDALNDDSSLTGITLTESGTPTLTLTVAQALGDTTALGEITNASYDIAIVDTCANVSQNFDALNADPSVTSITLTDAATASLTLTAAQALEDTVAFGEITNSAYTIAVSDTAENISSIIDALNSDTAVTSITLTDSGTPTLGLTVAQTLEDTRVLGEIANAAYGINVEDTAANILANASVLSADAYVTGAIVVDSAANVLDNAAALNADALVTSITVVDSVANIFANLSALQADAQVTSLVAVDTAANILGNAAALAGVSDITGIDVVDTAANVSANIDALNADVSVDSILLIDSGTPTLTLTAAQALNDTNALDRIVNTFAIDAVDTAADVAANIDALSPVAALAQITLTDAGTPTLTLTAAQAINDAAVIAMITNPGVQVVVSDTAADVAAEFDALNGDAIISGIVLTDAGTPTLTLTTAQALDDTTAFGRIENSNAQIAVSDTAADVSANIDALNADPAVSSITLTDSGTPTLSLSAAQILTDTAALGEITNANYEIVVYDSAANILTDNTAFAANSHFASAVAVDSAANVLAQEAEILADSQINAVIVTDTAANVSANFDALNADPELSAIVLTDSGVPTVTLTVAQALDDNLAIDSIANTNWAIAISDTAANVAANIDLLNGDAAITSISLTDSGTPTLQLSAGQVVADTEALSEITNQNYSIDVVDSAANVLANIAALQSVTQLASISLSSTGFGLPTFSLTAGQVASDAAVLAKITGDYAISVTDTASNVLAYQSALSENPQVTSLVVVDSAANILANAAGLQADTQITSLTVVDDVADVLADSASLANLSGLRIQVVDTAANVLASATALDVIPQISSITVVDSAANIGANLVQLADDYQISAIKFADSGTPVVPLTASELSSAWFLNRSGVNYTVSIVDTAANVLANIDQFYGWPISSITLTDSGVPLLTLSVDQAISDASILGEITNPTYGVSITDTGADVSANINALAAVANLSSITLTDGGTATLTLSVAQALNDTAVLSKITSNYTIAVSDTAANILANATALQADSSISSVEVNDTTANILANASALTADPQITNVTVVDSATNVVADSSALAASPLVSAIDVADTAAAISANVDALNGLSKLSAIRVTDFGTLTLTVAQTLDDTNVLNAISSGASIGVADTAANIANNLAALTADSNVTSLTVVDTVVNYLAYESVFASSTLPVQDELEFPPIVTITSAAEASNVANQTIAGTVVSGSAATVVGQVVTLTDNGTTLGTATVAADGTFTASVALPNAGTNSIVATVTDSLGNTGSSAATVDTLASSDIGYTLFGTAGGITLDGSGIPGAVAAYSLDNVTVDLATGTASVNGSSFSDTLIGISSGLVSGSNDTLIGGANGILASAGTNNTLIAGSGVERLASIGTGDTLIGGANDFLASAGSNNTLIAGSGVETLYSIGTDDTLIGNAAGSTLNGSAGTGALAAYTLNDVTVDLATGVASVNGSSTSDTLIGIANAAALGTGDTLISGSGDETLITNGTDNTLLGGGGADVLSSSYNGQNNALIAGSGDNSLTSEGYNDTLIGGDGLDSLYSDGSNNTLIAGDGTNILWTDGYEDTLIGGVGADTLTAGGYGNTLTAGTGVTVLTTYGNSDTLYGGSGTDSLTSDGYSNTLIAGTGNEVLSSSGTNDVLMGGSGDDTLISSGYRGSLSAGSGTNTLTASGFADVLLGGSGDDLLIATESFEGLIGGSGTSTLISNGSDNVLIAGSGLTTASYSLDDMDVDLRAGTAFVNGSYASDSLSGIDVAIVSGSDDTLNGGSGNDTLTAAGTTDTLDSGSGTDTLFSDASGNTLNGAAGIGAVAAYALDNVTVNLSAGMATVNGSGISDTLIDIASVEILGNNDTVIGSSGIDTLISGSSAATLVGGSGGDTLIGGSGIDTVSFGAIDSSAATFDFSDGLWTVATDGLTYSLEGIEKVQFADQIFDLVDQLGANVGGFQSVQSAINAASSGDTLLIAPGTYTESTIPAPYSSTPGGVFINTADLTLQGVDVDGSFITNATEAAASGPTIISGAETAFGSNFFIGPNATGTVIQGLHLAAGPETTNKLVEFWANNVTIENDFIDTYYDGADTGAAAIYLDTSGAPITQYLITGNLLDEGIYVANGVGTPGDGISTTQVISDNEFEGDFDYNSGAGRYDMVAVQGDIPGVAWQPDPAQVPTIEGNTLADNSAPFIFRMTEENPSLFPSASDVSTILADNTSSDTSYAYVLNSDGSLHLVDRNDGAGDYKSLYVANNIDTLELGLTGPNAIYGGYRDTIDPGDTVVVQSPGSATADITVDDLTINASAGSSDLNLTLDSGVTSTTLADYASGEGANVNVAANNLADTITGNSGNNVLTAGSGNDSFIGGGGYDTYQIGANMGQITINNVSPDGTATAQGEVDFGTGITDEQLWFQQSGSNLQIDLMGTTNQVTLDDWFGSNGSAQVQSFNTADGLKLDTQVGQLISAMATYSSNNPGFDPTAPSNTQAPNDPTLQAAITSSWHH